MVAVTGKRSTAARAPAIISPKTVRQPDVTPWAGTASDVTLLAPTRTSNANPLPQQEREISWPKKIPCAG